MCFEDTTENKIIFFAQYFNQCVLCSYLPGYNYVRVVGQPVFDITHLIINGYLQLKPISSVTEEDAKDLVRYKFFQEGGNPDTIDRIDIEIGTGERRYNAVAINSTIHFKNKETPATAVTLFISSDIQNLSAYDDILRKKGYATRWGTASVEELISRGWVKYNI